MDRTEARGNPPNKFAIYAPEEQQLHVESHSDQQRQSVEPSDRGLHSVCNSRFSQADAA